MIDEIKWQWLSESVEDTERLAGWIASLVEQGTVITLDGDLGAGKTTFSQAFARALGVTEQVSSPTFTIIKEYNGDQLPIYHMDVYRLSIQEADELGLDEYIYGDGITLIEWASIIEPLLPPAKLAIYIAYPIEDTAHAVTSRTFHITGWGAPYSQMVNTLQHLAHIGDSL
ncbi:tRNA (adenosine(37)-N6)-threonylcarbamoyltransferase complex ATPase subunit type 1 TsaE [Paenibacillus yanchengensis]|uniref:tRNA threonylcarbamoyladenosine biosynthesis protein TsaE n=1 Tax=Paenibacillus yanchengensis TaxID=2035833 RepID=A0ABW4YH20_9BACL